jgi:hypothetical protein
LNRHLLRSTVFALALGSVGIVASTQSADAETQTGYPISSTVYRKRMTDMIKTVRDHCNAKCPAEERAGVSAYLDKIASRVAEVCADGVVTAAENTYVSSVPQPPPVPHPSH